MSFTYITATFVALCRPTVSSVSFRAGFLSLRRTREVFILSVSTKASFAPFMLFSTVGSETLLPVFERTSKVSAAPGPSKTTAQQPFTRSSETSESPSRRFTE